MPGHRCRAGVGYDLIPGRACILAPFRTGTLWRGLAEDQIRITHLHRQRNGYSDDLHFSAACGLTSRYWRRCVCGSRRPNTCPSRNGPAVYLWLDELTKLSIVDIVMKMIFLATVLFLGGGHQASDDGENSDDSYGLSLASVSQAGFLLHPELRNDWTASAPASCSKYQENDSTSRHQKVN
jgi:hypothetical protein